MSDEKSRFVVSADWVESKLGSPAFKLVDASWYLPAQNRNAIEEFAAGHIPGAVFFDQDEIADHSTGLPHTIPAPGVFARSVGDLGISERDTIVVYDGPGFFAAPRVWWLFRAMGADDVFVLDGGMDAWKRDGRPVSTERPNPVFAPFDVHFHAGRVTSLDAMRSLVDEGKAQIADARGPGRFRGTEPEPRAGVRSGHMPGARNLPAATLSEGGRFKSLPELRKLIEDAGIDLTKPVVTSCGSGVTAAAIALALASLGHTDNTLYDGSWTEWGGLSDTPVVTDKDL